MTSATAFTLVIDQKLYYLKDIFQSQLNLLNLLNNDMMNGATGFTYNTSNNKTLILKNMKCRLLLFACSMMTTLINTAKAKLSDCDLSREKYSSYLYYVPEQKQHCL